MNSSRLKPSWDRMRCSTSGCSELLVAFTTVPRLLSAERMTTCDPFPCRCTYPAAASAAIISFPATRGILGTSILPRPLRNVKG